MKKALLALGFCLILTSCMSLLLEAPNSEIPASLSNQIRGYQIEARVGYLRQEVWTYHLLGLFELPLGSREGFLREEMLRGVLRQHVAEGQGVVKLRVEHSRTPLTWLATIVTLGLLSPTAVYIEGEIVQLSPQFKN